MINFNLNLFHYKSTIFWEFSLFFENIYSSIWPQDQKLFAFVCFGQK